jgi:acetyl esterase/lipase
VSAADTAAPTAGRLDPELAPIAAMMPKIELDDVPGARAALKGMVEAGQARADYSWQEHVDVAQHAIPGPEGAPEVAVYVYRPKQLATGAGVLLHIHGGAYVLGEAATGAVGCGRRCAALGIVIVDVEYRLAPEHPYPAGIEDCYAALVWAAEQAAGWGADPARLAVGGESAGGGLSASLALLARDRGGPALCFQLLNYPTVDDTCTTASAQGFGDAPLWNARNNVRMWPLYLGGTAGSGPVPSYAAAARAEDLGGLPPAYVLACDLDPLRDEDVAYAQRLADAGVPVELHLWPGTFHGFDGMPAEVSRQALATQDRALARALTG